jgi:hypothetical protein
VKRSPSSAALKLIALPTLTNVRRSPHRAAIEGISWRAHCR